VRVALVHDYLTQRGGAERVVLAMTRAFPDAPLYTSLYDPGGTFPEFGSVDVRPLALNAVGPLRHRHRLALPLLAPAFSRLRIAADVTLCSSSGWAHGVRVDGRKVVYCHTPARWLYQSERYLRGRPAPVRLLAVGLRRPLARWDRAAAASAHRYLANSTIVAGRIRHAYGVDPHVLPPPAGITPEGETEQVPGVDGGFFLTVSRLLPYKNIDAVVAAFAELPDERLVLVGRGPSAESLRRIAPPNVKLLGAVTDAQLRWLYATCAALVAASYEDFGLTPLEAATFGKPSAALRWGGFLDTIADGRTGILFERPESAEIAGAIRRVRSVEWRGDAIQRHATSFSEGRFVERLRAIVADEAATEPGTAVTSGTLQRS
jgi:glycosyltransferase involved in cell wall biosynthesis